jgi:hypothetical protein
MNATTRKPLYDPRERERDAAGGSAVLASGGSQEEGGAEAQEEARCHLHDKLFPSDSALESD